MRPRWALLAGLGALMALAPARAFAQTASAAPADEARTHFERGVSLLNVQNFEGALAEFERSYALSPRPSVLLNMGVALQSLHRYAESARMMERYLHDATNLPPARRAEIQHGIDEIRSLLARVRVHVEPAGATVRIDGMSAGTAPLAAPVEVGPGRHTIEIESNGQTVAHREFTIASGEEQTVRIVAAVPSGGNASAGTTSTAPATAPTQGFLATRGLPSGASLRVDARAVDAAHPVTLPAGTHVIEIRHDGDLTFRGPVMIAAGETRTVTPHLARNRRFGPAVFAVGVVATAASGIATGVFGALTLMTRSQFLTLHRDDPNASDVASTGTTYRTVTNVLIGATAVFAAATVVLFTQTRFGPATSTVDVAVGATPDGAYARAAIRF